jgi:hypothetical protein
MHSARIELPQSTRWDRAGIIGSLLCIGHCIATPFLAALLPVLAVTEKGTHIGFTAALMLIGLLAFIPGYRQHSRPGMALVALAGFAMLAFAAFIPEGLASEALETGLTVAGGALLITAHLTNAYYCRRCRVCAEEPCCSS